MSWNNALPWYIYELEREEREALALGAMPEEYNSGWTRSTPDFWITNFRNRWEDTERELYSLGVRIG